MSDPRTEARRRIVEVVRSHQCRETGACDCGFADWGCSHALHVADAVLELFERVEVRDLPGWVYGDGVQAARQLVLHGPVEPVASDEFKAGVAGFMDENAELMRRLAAGPVEPVVPEEPAGEDR